MVLPSLVVGWGGGTPPPATEPAQVGDLADLRVLYRTVVHYQLVAGADNDILSTLGSR